MYSTFQYYIELNVQDFRKLCVMLTVLQENGFKKENDELV